MRAPSSPERHGEQVAEVEVLDVLEGAHLVEHGRALALLAGGRGTAAGAGTVAERRRGAAGDGEGAGSGDGSSAGGGVDGSDHGRLRRG